MITAKEARENCYKCNNNNSKILSFISDFILEESSHGHLCCKVDIKATKNVKYNINDIQKELKQLGYDVVVDKTNDAASFKISWADEDSFVF